MWSRGPTVVHGCAMRHAAEAVPPRCPGHHKLAHERTDRYTSQRSGQRTGQGSHAHTDAARLDCPRLALGWGARRRSGSPSARQRARTAAAPCLPSLPPGGSRRKAPAPLRSARATASYHPATPSRGFCGSHTAPGGQRLCRSYLWSSAVFSPSLQAFGMYCRRASASRPGLAARTSRTATAVWPPAQAGEAGQASLGAGRPRSQAWLVPGTVDARPCLTRCGRGLADRAGATCPPTPRRSLRSQGRSNGLLLPGCVPRGHRSQARAPSPERPP